MSSVFAYVTNIERRISGLHSAGHCPVFKAVASNPSRDHESVFVKFVDDNGLFNEIFASHLGKFLNMPTADTYLCACPTFLLEKEDLPFSISPEECKLGVASVDANKIRFTGGDKALVKLENDLLSWPDLPMAAVFDELIINDDRNYQNILRVSDQKFKLIDHEQAFGRVNQTSNLEDVFSMPSKGNYLASLILNSEYELAKRRLYKAAKDIGEKIQLLTEISDPSLIYLEKNKLEDDYTDRMISLIKNRAQNLQELIHQHELSSAQLFSLSSN